MLSVRHYQADWISKWFEGPVKWEKEKKKKERREKWGKGNPNYTQRTKQSMNYSINRLYIS